ncbi:transposase [Kitasatospora sp. RG8]|nr:transposase [Kitasatospora sp. RG8]
MTAGTKAARTPGECGRRSCRSAIRAVTSGSRLFPGEAALARAVTARPPSPRVVAGWILRRPETLTETEHLRLKAVLVHCPELDALTGHVRAFGQMLTERQGERLPQWLDAVRQDDLPGLHTLAAGIDRDRDAVIAGLTLPWNSGVVEGHVNRIIMWNLFCQGLRRCQQPLARSCGADGRRPRRRRRQGCRLLRCPPVREVTGCATRSLGNFRSRE